MRYIDLDINLAGDDRKHRLFDHLARLSDVGLAIPYAPAVLIVGWTTGFAKEAS